jgi:homoserine acetyltransferase
VCARFLVVSFSSDWLFTPVQSEAMVDALRWVGGDVQLTVYPEAQHDSWTETYNNPKLYEWFLSHRKSVGSK